jgi:hypothetical protein
MFEEFLLPKNRIKMKKIILSTSLLAMMAMFGNEVFATDKYCKNLNETKHQSEFNIRQIGQDESAVYLRLSFRKDDDKQASIRISDGSGEQLFIERFSQDEYYRVIKISPDELNEIEVEFRTASGSYRKKYAIHMSRINNFQIEELAAK